VGFDFCSDVAN